MYKSLGYRFDEINCYHNVEKLCIGFIIECKEGSDYGIIYQYNDEGLYSECKGSALYFFKKDTKFVIPSKTCVTFVKNFSNSWKKNFEVSNIHLLDEYYIYILQSEEEKKSYYHTSSTETMERLINEGQKFIVIDNHDSDYTSRMYMPIIDDELKLVKYYFFTACFQEEPGSVFESFIYNKVNCELIAYPNINFIIDGINRITKYVQSLDLNIILSRFSVYDEGHFQSRPGRDDHYIYSKYAQCSSNDSYLRQLTKLKNEVTGYYNCLGREQDDFKQINVEDTKKLQNEVVSKYNAGEHLSYLLSEFISNVEKVHEIANSAAQTLTSFIRKGDEMFFDNKPSTLLEWKEIISSHNHF